MKLHKINYRLIKTTIASMFNLVGAYLFFYPQPYPYHIYKFVGFGEC